MGWVLVGWTGVATGVSARVGCGCRDSAVCERERRRAGGGRPISKPARRRGDTGVRSDFRFGDAGFRLGDSMDVVVVEALFG